MLRLVSTDRPPHATVEKSTPAPLPPTKSSRPLTIGICIALLPPEHLGGAELQADRMARELARRGHRVHVFARRQSGRARREVRAGVVIHRRPVLPLPGLRALADVLIGALQAARQRPDVLLSYMTFNNGVLALLAAANIVLYILRRRPESSLDPALLERFRLRLRGWWILCAVLAGAFARHERGPGGGRDGRLRGVQHAGGPVGDEALEVGHATGLHERVEVLGQVGRALARTRPTLQGGNRTRGTRKAEQGWNAE